MFGVPRRAASVASQHVNVVRGHLGRHIASRSGRPAVQEVSGLHSERPWNGRRAAALRHAPLDIIVRGRDAVLSVQLLAADDAVYLHYGVE